MQPRALVRAVLAPHDAEDAEFGIARLAAEDRDDLVVFLRRELVLSDEIRRDGRRAHARTAAAIIDWNTTSPSHEPISGSVASSGCGIIPITFRSRFRMPAISRSEPFGFCTYRK